MNKENRFIKEKDRYTRRYEINIYANGLTSLNELVLGITLSKWGVACGFNVQFFNLILVFYQLTNDPWEREK